MAARGLIAAWGSRSAARRVDRTIMRDVRHADPARCICCAQLPVQPERDFFARNRCARRPCYPRPPCVVCVIVVGELEVRMNPQNLDARLAKRSFHIRTINSSVLTKYVCCRGRPCRDEDVRVCQRCDMCWLMGVGARADRWRNDWLERSSDRPGRVVWLGEQMAAFPSTKIAKPTRCNRTKAAVGRFEPRFPSHHCDLCFCAYPDSHASHTLPNPADRGELGWRRESSGCVGPWPVRC